MLDAHHIERAKRVVNGAYARQQYRDPATLDLIHMLESENAGLHAEIEGFSFSTRALSGRTVFRRGILAYLAIAGLITTGSWLHYSAR